MWAVIISLYSVGYGCFIMWQKIIGKTKEYKNGKMKIKIKINIIYSMEYAL